MQPAMQSMFPAAETLVRFLLINPVLTATAERSFSSLRRLKSYTWSTCGQPQLNNIVQCHVQKETLGTLDKKHYAGICPQKRQPEVSSEQSVDIPVPLGPHIC